VKNTKTKKNNKTAQIKKMMQKEKNIVTIIRRVKSCTTLECDASNNNKKKNKKIK
jgi:hypothetical protein